MMRGISLQELAAKIEGNRALKQDYITDTRKLTMVVPPPSDEPNPKPLLEVEGQGRFPIRPLAHDQIGGRLGIPSKYYDRMLDEDRSLLATNVNTWFRRHPETRMVRTLGGDTRAFLSNRYNRIENEEIASVALPVLAEIPEVKIVSCEVTEKRLYIQAVSPRVTSEVKRGDVVQAGVIISNSEVGCGSVSVSPLVWRLICRNGMVRHDEKFKAYHVGRRIEDNADLWQQDTVKADDRAVLLKVRDMVRASVDDARFAQAVQKMQSLTEGRENYISGNPAKAVEVLATKVGVSDEEQGGILRSLIEGSDLSAWGMLNAVTAQAHSARSYDRAVEFEQAGGMLLNLPRTAWNEILQAA